MKKVALHNLGCKVNAYETEGMQQMLEQAGYEIVPFEEKADIYIVNTCSVTNIADRKSRQMLHRAKKQNPEGLVVAVGCYVQTAEAELREDAAVDLLIGNNRKKDLLAILKAYEEGVDEETVIDINHTKEYENMTVTKTAEHTRAYVKVQDGCNQFCSYCVIPYARGRVRSRESADVCAEIRELAAAGYREVVLTGIHLSSYGVDLEGENLLTPDSGSGWDRRYRPHSSGLPGTPDYHRRICGNAGKDAEVLSSFPPVPSERLRRHPEADEPSLYRGRIRKELRTSPGKIRPSGPDHGRHRGIPWRDRRGICGDGGIPEADSFI